MSLRILLICLTITLGGLFTSNATAQTSGLFWSQNAKDFSLAKLEDLEMAGMYVLENWDFFFPHGYVAGTSGNDIIQLIEDGDEIELVVTDAETGELQWADRLNVAENDSQIVIFVTHGHDVVINESIRDIMVVGSTNPDGDPDRQLDIFSQGNVQFFDY